MSHNRAIVHGDNDDSHGIGHNARTVGNQVDDAVDIAHTRIGTLLRSLVKTVRLLTQFFGAPPSLENLGGPHAFYLEASRSPGQLLT